MKLKTTKKTIFEVDYYVLESFVNSLFGTDWSFVSDHQAHNDTSYTFNIKKGEITGDSYERDDFEYFLQNSHSNAYLILGILANQDLIEEGEYIINVSW